MFGRRANAGPNRPAVPVKRAKRAQAPKPEASPAPPPATARAKTPPPATAKPQPKPTPETQLPPPPPRMGPLEIPYSDARSEYEQLQLTVLNLPKLEEYFLNLSLPV